jgi:putative transposase
MDGLLENVDSQRCYAAHLNARTNASCESFMKTLKREEIYARDYRDLEHVLESVEGFIENYYNRCRLHSALGYRSPEEFESESVDRNGDASFGAATIRAFKTLTGIQN